MKIYFDWENDCLMTAKQVKMNYGKMAYSHPERWTWAANGKICNYDGWNVLERWVFLTIEGRPHKVFTIDRENRKLSVVQGSER